VRSAAGKAGSKLDFGLGMVDALDSAKSHSVFELSTDTAATTRTVEE
jgi:hypothetical protein